MQQKRVPCGSFMFISMSLYAYECLFLDKCEMFGENESEKNNIYNK